MHSKMVISDITGPVHTICSCDPRSVRSLFSVTHVHVTSALAGNDIMLSLCDINKNTQPE